MNKLLHPMIAALALTSTVSAQAAEPAQPCLEKAELRGLVGYFLPNVLREVSANCAPSLSANSYLRRAAPAIVAELEAGKAAAWPVARSAFFKLSGAGDAKAMAALPDKDLRPLVDATMTEKIKIPVTANTCGEINDIAETLAPLSTPQTVDLVTAILATAGRNGKGIRSCPRELK